MDIGRYITKKNSDKIQNIWKTYVALYIDTLISKLCFVEIYLSNDKLLDSKNDYMQHYA